MSNTPLSGGRSLFSRSPTEGPLGGKSGQLGRELLGTSAGMSLPFEALPVAEAQASLCDGHLVSPRIEDTPLKTSHHHRPPRAGAQSASVTTGLSRHLLPRRDSWGSAWFWGGWEQPPGGPSRRLAPGRAEPTSHLRPGTQGLVSLSTNTNCPRDWPEGCASFRLRLAKHGGGEAQVRVPG